MSWISRARVVEALRTARRLCGPGERPVLELAINDHRLHRLDFVKCTNGGYQGLDQGQSSECRWQVDDGREGLHMHQYAQQGILRFHLDDVDPLRNGPGHLFADTNAGTGLAFGGLLALLLADENPLLALGVAALGTYAGAQQPKWRYRTFTLQSLSTGSARVVGIPRGSCAQYAFAYA